MIAVLFERNSRPIPAYGPKKKMRGRQESATTGRSIVSSQFGGACILVHLGSLSMQAAGETVHAGSRFEVPNLSMDASDNGPGS